MKASLILLLLLVISIAMPMSSFAQKPINCHFGDESTTLDDIFKNDLAVKAFTEKHPDAIRYIAIDDSLPPNGELSYTIENNETKEVLLVEFTQNENGCYRPKQYIYSFHNETIDATVKNSLGNFTEIMDLIKLDHKKIEDFYTKNCNPISLDYVLDGDTKPYFCKSDRDGIQMYVQDYVGGPIEIHIPDKTMDALFYNCNLNGDFFVLHNSEEIDFDMVAENDKRIFKMNLLPGYNKIEILGLVNLSGTEGFCGSIWSDDSRYISPNLQAKIGVEPWMVKCNDGLTLLLKPTEFTKPACVTNETFENLSHRGWAVAVSDYQDWQS